MFFSNTRWTQLLAPLEILIRLSKISLKYIPIHIHNFEHFSGGDFENEIIQPWLPV